MKFRNWIVVAAVAAAPFPGAFGFQQEGAGSQDQLPAAPSATLEQRRPATPAPASPTPPSQTAEPGSSASAPAPAAASDAPPAPSAPVKQPSSSAQPQGASVARSASDDQPLETIRKTVDEVSVVFTVTDKRGRFVKHLTQQDIKVLDDKKPPAAIVNFSSETNLPLRVGLLVDASNSIRDRFKFEQEAAIEFLNQIIRPRSDQAFVLGFDTTAEVTQDFTDSTEKLSRGIRMLRPGGGTALYDAVYYACRDKLMKASGPGTNVRRAIILLSDGDDNQSRVTREEAIDMAQRAEVIVYAISTNVSGVKLKGDKVLERMAEATGGRAFFPFKIEDVANAFSDIQDELRSQYAIAYRPADFVADGHFRSIDIKAEDGKLKVRARRGYYAPSQ